jgi:hypothetical protein
MRVAASFNWNVRLYLYLPKFLEIRRGSAAAPVDAFAESHLSF